MRLSYTFFYKIKQIINLQYAGKKVSSKFWPSLKKVEVSLAADTMLYKTLDLETLLTRGFPGHTGPANDTKVNPKDLFLDDVTFNLITTMYNEAKNNTSTSLINNTKKEETIITNSLIMRKKAVDYQKTFFLIIKELVIIVSSFICIVN